MATWALDPDVTHLNHGSFGACPIEVLAHQAQLRTQMETNPVAFMLYEYQPLLERSRAALAEFVGADTEGLVFVPNATFGVNSVLRSLEASFPPGGEIVVGNQTYNACRNAAEYSARRFGGSVVVADIPFPIRDAALVVERILDAVTERTVLVLLDHVTSPTAVVWPVAEIVGALEPDIPVLVDGAHAPGMIDVDVTAIGASFYTANCHKWICSPKGAGFLHVAERHRAGMQAAVIGHGFNGGWPGSSSRFHAQFDWTGTDDPSARLSVGAAIGVMADHRSGGWDDVRRTNHELAIAGRDIVSEAIGAEVPVPEHMIGSIAAIELRAEPGSTIGRPTGPFADSLGERLHQEWRIEVPVMTWPDPPLRLVRVSAQQYNRLDDYRRLAEALRTLC
jgi:isopenicillin-N epimerase